MTDAPARDPHAVRRPAGGVIDAVLRQMRENLEPLKYSTLAPSRFLVYLHPDEFARLEGILPILQEQTRRALTEEVESLNRRRRMTRWAGRLLGDDHPPVENPAGAWDVEFLPDPDGDLANGAILIDSELVLPAVPELGLGERTRRVSTIHLGAQATTRERTEQPTAPVQARPAVIARLSYEDDSGRHVYEMTRDVITVGRGGVAYHVDLRLVASPDVSREHLRIRRDFQTSAFFLLDLSSLGTTLNGRHVPRGYDDVDGHKRENGTETPLPDTARIGLADTVFIDFAVVR